MSKKIKIILSFVVALIIFFTSWFILSNQEEKELKLAQKWAGDNGLSISKDYPDWVKPLPVFLRKYFRQRAAGIYKETIIHETIMDSNGVVLVEQIEIEPVDLIDLSPIQNLKYLKSISIKAKSIKNFSVIKNLKNLEDLEITGSITDVEVISYIKRLKVLNLESKDVSDLEPLKNLKNLERLILTSTKIKSLEPLYNLQRLKYIVLTNNVFVNKEEVEKLKAKFPECYINFNDVSNH